MEHARYLLVAMTMPRKKNMDSGAAFVAAAELCLRSKTPCILFTVPELAPVAASTAYGEIEGDIRQRPQWPDLAVSLRAAAQAGRPAELEIEGGTEAVRLHCAPVGGVNASGILVWLNGPRVASEEAKRAAAGVVAAKSRFLAAASHDLRQPFQAMRFFHSVLSSQVGDGPARRTADMLGGALNSGEQLLNALLDISTLDAGTVEPRLQCFDLGEVVRRVAAEFQPDCEHKGLSLRIRAASVPVRTDPVLLERIVRNLLANAVTYTRSGGILVGLRRRSGKARIEVWDTGFGIPEDQQAAIFEEFHQLDNPERDRNRGLGLGLAIVRGLSQLLNTPIEVRSTLGRGTVFMVSVPMGRVAADQSTKEVTAQMSAKTVLVVEDDDMVLMGLTMILETWGINVLAAEDMTQVLQKLDHMRPDLILSDLRLRGGLTGFEVVERVRAMLGETVPAIILTGETGKAELEEGRRRQLAFLHKPIQPETLKQAVAKVLEG